MHYRGLLRVARRDGGMRVYAAREHAPAPAARAGRRARIDALVDVVVAQVRAAAGAHAGQLAQPPAALRRAAVDAASCSARLRAPRRGCRARASTASTGTGRRTRTRRRRATPDERVRLLAPFDPVVWDRRRFELFWGWAYRFEAYTPAPKRKLGYYALPLLWRDRVIGWGNLSVVKGEHCERRSGMLRHDRRRSARSLESCRPSSIACAQFLGLESESPRT